MSGAKVLSLGALVFFSALALVVTRHESRMVFVELQRAQGERDDLAEQWGRLQLEQATWATHGRVEDIARSRLNMRSPRGDALRVVSP